MDATGETNKARDAVIFTEDYLRHPITQAVFRDSEAEQESLVLLICERPITNLETFFAHFEAVGHLRGLRRQRAIIAEKLEEVQEELKKAQEDEHRSTERPD